ncbi:MAG TPA: PEP-CTERM sorting domain-containing protein [Rhodocyclaceae bacterium]|nr:PEP-CTERM sorting domain-containing protein [Rhodocyclaceae bacterium]
MKFKLLAVTAMLCVTAPSFAAPITFSFIYNDAAGTGFNDPVLGAQRKAALEEAGDYWSGLLNASYAGETINISASFSAVSTSTTPLSASQQTNQYINAGLDNKGFINVSYSAPLAEYVAGRNLNGSSADYNLVFSPNVPEYLGLDGNPPAGQFDFETYGIRSIARTLGVVSRIDRALVTTDGSQQGGFSTQFNPSTGALINAPSIYDTFLVDGSGTSLLAMTDAQRVTAVTTGNLYWNGANAIAANGGVRPKLYAPALNADGTINGNSIVYLEESAGTLLSFQSPHTGIAMGADAVTLGELKDLGWSVAAVPEPSTYAMLLAGLGMIGFVARRRCS